MDRQKVTASGADVKYAVVHSRSAAHSQHSESVLGSSGSSAGGSVWVFDDKTNKMVMKHQISTPDDDDDPDCPPPCPCDTNYEIKHVSKIIRDRAHPNFKGGIPRGMLDNVLYGSQQQQQQHQPDAGGRCPRSCYPPKKKQEGGGWGKRNMPLSLNNGPNALSGNTSKAALSTHSSDGSCEECKKARNTRVLTIGDLGSNRQDSRSQMGSRAGSHMGSRAGSHMGSLEGSHRGSHVGSQMGSRAGSHTGSHIGSRGSQQSRKSNYTGSTFSGSIDDREQE